MAGRLTGLGSPVPQHQEIEFVGDFGVKNF
jgi:hypothetical protein